MPTPLAANETTPDLQQEVAKAHIWISALRAEIGKAVVGQQYLIDRLIIGLLANGHVLLEGVPGLAKTLSVQSLASALHASFKRIQFTPDLLPSDIVGTLIYNPKEGDYRVTKGPVFANILLADEINRSPAKVQAALLEAMQERQVTLAGETHPLPRPFLVLATENPIDQEGTYPLPEAQVDRFMLKLTIGYPDRSEERRILDTMSGTNTRVTINPVASTDDILAGRTLVDAIRMENSIRDYIVSIVLATRDPKAAGIPALAPLVRFGASPRATIALALASRARALLQGRTYVVPQDVKDLAHDVLRHRIILSYEAEAESVSTDDVITRLLAAVPVP